MKRLQKQFLTALGLVVVGGGAGLYTLREKVKTPEVRFRELRESQRLFRFGRIDVKSGTLTSKTGTVAFVIGDDGRPHIAQPLSSPGNPEVFASLFNHMASLILEPVLSEEATDEEIQRAGLDRPPITLALTLKDDRQLTLYIGRKNKLLDRYPVTDVHKKKIGLIEPSGVWNYTRPLNDYRDKRVFPVVARAVDRVDVEMPPGRRRFTLTRGEHGWSLDDPNGSPAERADEQTVDLFLALLTKQLEIDEFVSDRYDGAKAADYGLAPPTLRLSVRTPKQTLAALVGFVKSTDAEDGTTFVHREGTTTLIRNSDPTLRNDLLKPARTFVDRTLSKFDPKEAHRVLLQRSGRATVKVERSEKGWQLIEPETHDAKPWKLDAMVRLVAQLRANSWYQDDATDAQLRLWQLSPWDRRLTIEAADGRTLADIALGKPVDDVHRFVKAWTGARVGLIAETTLRVLPDRWQELKRDP